MSKIVLWRSCMYHRILVALDGSAESERILPWVRPLIQESGGKVRLLRVYAPMQSVTVGTHTIAYGHRLEWQTQMTALAYLRRVASYLRADGTLVAFEARCGDPVEVILAVAWAASVDLIAMATRTAADGRRPRRQNITAEVMGRAPVAVLVARDGDQRAACP
jgi:nucleotide-binding universal stress UspA family protein